MVNIDYFFIFSHFYDVLHNMSEKILKRFFSNYNYEF